MNLGGVMVFEPAAGGAAPTVEAVRELLAARLSEIPRYLQRLSSTRTRALAWPHWVPDDRFDIRHHVGHALLPAPGDSGQLSDWTAEFFSLPLDRKRPLWEIVLVEGLQSGRWALGWKTHHCLVDGVVAVELIGLLLGPGPTAPTAPTRGRSRRRRGARRADHRCGHIFARPLLRPATPPCARAAPRLTLRPIPGRRWTARAGSPS